jgi:hypothetical protein
MPDPSLLSYINLELRKGINAEVIKKTLLSKGWQNQQVDEAFSAIGIHGEKPIPQPTPPNYFPRIFPLFKESWMTFSHNWKTYFLINLLPILIIIIFLILSFVTGMFKSGPNFPFAYFYTLIPIYLIVAIFIMMWSNLAMIHAVSSPVKSIILSYKNTLKRIIPFFGLAILTGIIVLLGYIFLIIPGIILSLWFLFASYVFVVEGKSITGSIKASKNYIKPYLFEVFVRIIEFGMLIGIMSSALNLIPLVGGIIGSLIVGPLTIIFYYVLYIRIRSLNGQKISNPLPKRVKYEVFGLLGLITILIVFFLFFFVKNIFTAITNNPCSSGKLCIHPIPTKNEASLAHMPTSTPTPSPLIMTKCSQCSATQKYNREVWLEEDSTCDKSSIVDPSAGVWLNLDCSCTNGTIEYHRSLACETKKTLCNRCSYKWAHIKENWIENDSICDKSSVDKTIIDGTGLSGEVDGIWYNIDCSCGSDGGSNESFAKYCSYQDSLTPTRDVTAIPTIPPPGH